ncbi:MAG: YhbY family RNA-binding protein [Myxococcota bacterium]
MPPVILARHLFEPWSVPGALTAKQARHLRALAHHLDPVVRVGAAGVSDAVVEKTVEELEIHELIKVRIDGDRDEVRDGAHAPVERTPARSWRRSSARSRCCTSGGGRIPTSCCRRPATADRGRYGEAWHSPGCCPPS